MPRDSLVVNAILSGPELGLEVEATVLRAERVAKDQINTNNVGVAVNHFEWADRNRCRPSAAGRLDCDDGTVEHHTSDCCDDDDDLVVFSDR